MESWRSTSATHEKNPPGLLERLRTFGLMLATVTLLARESFGLAVYNGDRKLAEVPGPELSRIASLFRLAAGSMSEVEEGRSRREPE